MAEEKEWVNDESRGPVFAGLDTIDYPHEITSPDEWYEPPADIVKAHEKGGVELAFAEACRVIYQLCYTVQELRTELNGLERRHERHKHVDAVVVKD